MDRGAFLRALPFFQETSDWPDQCQSLWTKDHVVSIEPLSGDSGESIGPAYFAISADNDDPMLCPMEAAICVSERKPHRASFSSSSTTISSVSPSPKTPTPKATKTKEASAEQLIDLYFRFDNQCMFRVDCSCLDKITVLPAVHKSSQQKGNLKDDSTSAKSETKNSITGKDKHLPPCLLFYFESCCFRVFSLSKGLGNAEDVLQSALAKLQTVQIGKNAPSLLETYLQEEAATTSPGTGSNSAQSTVEPGQREQVVGESAKPNSSFEDDATKAQEEDLISKNIKRKHESLGHSWTGLQNLSTVLDMPASALGSQLQSTASVAETFGPLLTATAEDLTQARLYSASQSHVSAKATIQRYQEKVDKQQQELNTLLGSAFPSPLKKRRGMRGCFIAGTPQTQNISTQQQQQQQRQPPPSMKELVDRAKEALAKQKEALQIRHELALLP